MTSTQSLSSECDKIISRNTTPLNYRLIDQTDSIYEDTEENSFFVCLFVLGGILRFLMGKQWKQCQALFWGAPKSLQMVIAAMKLKDAYSLEGKSWPWKESIFKSRDITLPIKVRLVKAMVFPVVMYGCESWTVKKAERRRIDAFELWCWGRLWRVPWTTRRSN